jgi:outer membrane protein assembly factor BamB
VLSDDGFLYKLQCRNGKRAWRFDTRGGAVKRAGYDRLASSAVTVDGTVYIGSADGSLYALDPKTGHERWHYFTQGMVRSTPAVADGRVFFGSYDHAVYALDAKHGSLLWRRDTLMPVVSTPLVVKDLVYIGSRNADFYALNAADGKVRWRAFDWVSWVESSASERDGTVYVGCSDCWDLFAYDAVSGKEQWRYNSGGESWPIPALDAKYAYIGSVGYDGYGRLGGFYAVDRSTGKAAWRFDFPPSGGEAGYGVGASPVLGEGKVFFGGLDGVFYAFAVSD